MADTKGIVRKRHRFLFIAPDANEVCVAGSFNQWDPEATPMKKRRDGTWYAVVYLSPGRYEYRIVVDGIWTCLLYTSDAADDLLCVDLGGRRII